jgi:hypothetical protein
MGLLGYEDEEKRGFKNILMGLGSQVKNCQKLAQFHVPQNDRKRAKPVTARIAPIFSKNDSYIKTF